MISKIFLDLLNISITANWIVLAVLLLRLLLKKAPKWISCLLWSIVALRLLIPVHAKSSLSLIPSAEVIPRDIATASTPAIHSGIPAVNSAVNPLLLEHADSAGSILQQVLSYAALVWLIGAAALLLYGAVSSLRLRRQVQASLCLQDNVYICDDVDSPFILGIFRPRIYAPSDLSREQLQHVLAHEKAHLKRKDHWWKPLGFLLLSIYWFNPVMWLAYILLSRDIEQACDEKVISSMSTAQKKGYSETLAACSLQRRMILACPVAFGEVSVKTRIKGILNYKKPAFRVILTSVAACAVAAVCFLTDPLPCKHNFKNTVLAEASCTQEGQHYHTCSKCGYSYTDAIALLSHSFGEKTVTQETTCTQEGQISAQCTVCKQTCVVERLAKTQEHHLAETVVRPATCTREGEGKLVCAGCGYCEKCSYAQLEHSFELEYIYPSGCTFHGYKKMVCSGCGAVNRIELPFSDEHYYCTNPLTGVSCCASCGKVEPKTMNSIKKNPASLPPFTKPHEFPTGS